MNYINQTIANRALFIAIALIFLVGCAKENTPVSDNIGQLFVSFTAEDSVYNFRDNEAGYEEGIYLYEIPPQGKFGCGASMLNDEYRLSNVEGTPIDNFTLMFHDIVSDNLETGEFQFKGSVIENDTLDQGAEIYWMTKANWDNLIGYLKTTPKYIAGQSHYDKKLIKGCDNSIYYTSDFFSTKLINQPQSRVTITRIQTKPYLVYTSPTTSEEMTEYIISGNFNCSTASRLDSANVIHISGDFKLHLPSFKRFGWE